MNSERYYEDMSLEQEGGHIDFKRRYEDAVEENGLTDEIKDIHERWQKHCDVCDEARHMVEHLYKRLVAAEEDGDTKEYSLLWGFLGEAKGELEDAYETRYEFEREQFLEYTGPHELKYV